MVARSGVGRLVGAQNQGVVVTFASLSAGFCLLHRGHDHVLRHDRDERVGQGQRGFGVICREQYNRVGVDRRVTLLRREVSSSIMSNEVYLVRRRSIVHADACHPRQHAAASLIWEVRYDYPCDCDS